jgi:ATP-dependent helicase/nuclease subunit A
MWCLPEVESDAAPVSAADERQPDRDEKSVSTLRRREADWIAQRICQLVAGVAPAGAPPLEILERSSTSSRRVRKGDIAILFRALSDVAFYEEALRSYGVDYYLVGGHAFYAQQEIYDVLNLLRSFASPADEVALAGVLRSPFFSLSDEALFWLAQDEHGLWRGLCNASPPMQLDPQTQERVVFAANVLSELRQLKDRMPIADLLNEALARTGYDAALLGEFLGERKLANLRKLVEQARAIDRGGVLGLSGFIVQLSQFVAREPREPLAATQPEATDVVRLMSIHQAKGLEFPVVFVPDLARHGNERTDLAVYSNELGPLVRLPREHECHGVLDGHRLHAIASSAEDKQEAIRLLYVAATRAADFLVLSSGVRKLDEPRGTWMSLLASRFELPTGRLIGSLPEGYAAPRVRVLTAAPQTENRAKKRRSSVDLAQLAAEIEAAAQHDVAPSAAADPIACDVGSRRRFSISRLQPSLGIEPAQHEVESRGELPPLVRGRAVELGMLVHAVLANLDYRQTNDLSARVRMNADKLGLCDAKTREEAQSMVARFVASPRADKLRRAQRMHPEVEFLLAWPPGGGRPDGQNLQGFIDCLYQDGGGRWHVLDYKTNQVSTENIVNVATVYEMQMLAYGLAAEQALGEPVTELALHFLRTGQEHTFVWDDSARRRGIELVNSAMGDYCRGEDVQLSNRIAQPTMSPELVG